MASGASSMSASSHGNCARAGQSGAAYRKSRRSMEMESLAMIVPGGPRKKGGVQNILLGAISYIQFLQCKIEETYEKLLPYSSQQNLLPLLTLRRSGDATRKRRKARQRIRRGWPRGSVLMPKQKSQRIPRQKLVPYVSSSSSDNGDGGPWLVSVSVSPQSPLSPCTSQFSSAAPLELSPLLLSPPPALFEELEIGSWSEDVQDPAMLAISLDHRYQSCDDCSNNSPHQLTKGSDMVAKCPEPTPQLPVEVASGTGNRRCIKVNGAKRKAKRQQECSSTTSDTASYTRSIGTALTQKPRTFSGLQQFRKKCVNGFIMFCRLNRRPYLSAHPGKASTAATKDLAELWKVMSARERRPYCMKALQFSLLHGRMVKCSSSRLPHANMSPPKPLSVLLAEKAAQLQDLEEP